jgi:hypothetical protein
MGNQAEYKDALFIPSDARSNFKNVIAKRSDLAKFASGRLVASNATHEAGEVLGVVTISGRWAPYASTNIDGSEVARGVLAEQAICDSSDNGTEVAILVGGTLFQDLLIGYDATAKAALMAKEYAEHGVNLVDF